MSPTKFIYQIIETPSLGNDEQFLIREMTSGLGHMRGIILLLPFIFLFVCTSRYLFCVKKHSRYTTMPISDLHRIITLWFFTFVIMTIGNLTFYVLDLSTVSIFKLLFMEKNDTRQHRSWDPLSDLQSGVLFQNIRSNILRLSIDLFSGNSIVSNRSFLIQEKQPVLFHSTVYARYGYHILSLSQMDATPR